MMEAIDLREDQETGGGRATVLALHGQPGHGSDFAAVGEALPSRFQLLAEDRPGWGRRAREEAMGFAGNARDAVRSLDVAGVESAIVVGHSWGGGIALDLAMRHPGRVQGLVLVSSVGPGAIHLVDRVLDTPGVGWTITSVGLWFLRVGLTLPTRLLTGKSTVDTSGWPTRSFIVEQDSLVEELPSLNDQLGRIAAPTVVLSGDRDRVVPHSVAERLVEDLPTAELATVPGSGHRLLDSAPTQVAEAVERIDELSRRLSDGARGENPSRIPR